MFRFLWWLPALVLGLVLNGCGSNSRPEPKRVPVSGTVTLDGKPMAEGTIYFKTVQQGSVDTLDIKDGKFQGPAEPGERRVEVCQFREGPPIEMGPKGKLPNKINSVPARYNVNSTLTAMVKDKGPNEFTFAVTSK